MSPRPYRLGLRETAVEATRERIIEAACELLASGGFGAFTIDTVARAADVSRMTVYNQFGSKAGLLEAIFDWVAERGDVRRLGEAAGHPDPDEGLALFVHACCALWASNRAVQRRLVGLAAIDPDFEAALSSREERRAGPVRALLTRLSVPPVPPPPASRGTPPTARGRDEAGGGGLQGAPQGGGLEAAVQRVMAVTSFSSVDALAGDADPLAVVELVQSLVRCALDHSRELGVSGA